MFQTIAITTLPAILISIVGYFLFIYRSEYKKRIDAEKALSSIKYELYRKFSDSIFNYIRSFRGGGRDSTNDDFGNFIVENRGPILLYGSDDVVKKYIELVGSFSDKENKNFPYNIIISMCKLIISMRADMGRKNKIVSWKDMLKLSVSKELYDEIIKMEDE